MGVITTMYSVEPNMMKKVKADNDNLAYITGDCEENDNWEFESFDFDSSIEIYMDIFFNAGAKKSRKLIDSECADLGVYEFESYDIWSISPANVKIMVKELEAITPAMGEKIIKDNLIDNHETEVLRIERKGFPLTSEEIQTYLESIDDLKQFLSKVMSKNNYLIITEG